MKASIKFILGLIIITSTLFTSCGASSSTSSRNTKSVNHYHHGVYGGMGWRNGHYYNRDIIVIDRPGPEDGNVDPDFGVPDMPEMPSIPEEIETFDMPSAEEF